MHCTREAAESIVWVGGSDRRLSLFENLFPVPNGVSYNSYVILDEKTALIDTVDSSITELFLENLLHTLDGRTLDYLVVNHMEPDHCAVIGELAGRFPELKLVGNAKTAGLLTQFFGPGLAERTLLVKEGETLSLGAHTLRFLMAPMVHWPEVMMTYDETARLLFSADAFGTFGALDGKLFADEFDLEQEWLPEARRYYSNIVGKYGAQVQAVLKKAAGLDIQSICPLHGPVWREKLDWLLDKYGLWSSYQPEEKGVLVVYGSMYGSTARAADILAAQLSGAGVKNLAVYDVSTADVSALVAGAFRFSHLVLASPTYNGGIYPPMLNFLQDMKALNLQNRTVGLIENGSWAPVCGKQMSEMLEGMKNVTVLEPAVTIRSTLSPDSLAQLTRLGDSLLASLNEA